MRVVWLAEELGLNYELDVIKVRRSSGSVQPHDNACGKFSAASSNVAST